MHKNHNISPSVKVVGKDYMQLTETEMYLGRLLPVLWIILMNINTVY